MYLKSRSTHEIRQLSSPPRCRPREQAPRRRLQDPEAKSSFTLNALLTESAEKFKALRDAYVARFKPADTYELGLVATIAACTWQKHRLGDWEAAIIDLEIKRSSILDPAFRALPGDLQRALAMAEKSVILRRMSQYQSSLDFRWNRASKALKTSQEGRAIKSMQNEGKSQNRTPEKGAGPNGSGGPPSRPSELGSRLAATAR